MGTLLGTMERWRQAGRWQDEAAWLRIRSQVRFAEWLASRPKAPTAWRHALQAAHNLLEPSRDASPETLAARLEDALRPLSKAAKRHTVHCAGHAHIDMNWMWGWPETVAATLDSFRTVLALMEEFPEFHFSQSQASIYAIVAQYDPAMLAAIAGRVREGRWEVTASHWVENDANLSGTEPLVRHLLQTRAAMRDWFGLEPGDVAVNWAPDTFGHAATGPSYLAQGGVRHVYLHRPGGERQPVPEAFWWQGPDGARVLVRNDQRRGYNGILEPGAILEAVEAMERDTGLDFTLLVYGVGDHGGGPTRRDLLLLREMATWPVFPTLVPSSSRAFFDRLEREGGNLPTLTGELNFEFAGCYTSQALIKRDNRLGEARMLDAETVTALAAALGAPTADRGAFDTNWRRVLFSHFHDILPGSGVRDTRLYCHGQFQETMAFTSMATAQALRHLAARIDTQSPCGTVETLPPPPALFTADGFGGGSGCFAVDGRAGHAHGHGTSPVRPFVVFNTTPAGRTEVVEFTLWDRELPETAAAFVAKRFEAVGPDGRILPVQRMETSRQWGHAFQRYAAPVDVPAFGYTTVVFREASDGPAAPGVDGAVRPLTPAYHCAYARTERTPLGFENNRLRVAFYTATGRVASLYDKVADRELLALETGIGLEYAIERAGAMSAWVIDPAGPAQSPVLAAVREIAAGPLVAAVELTFRVNASTVRLTYRLEADSARLQMGMEADWLEHGGKEIGTPNLRLAIGTALAKPTASYEIPFGWIGRRTRPDQEVSALRWALLESDTSPAGLLAINDCKHGHAVDGGTLRINLIRSSFEPDKFPELGEHKAQFALAGVSTPHAKADATRAAQAFTHPLWVQGTTVHAGPLPAENGLVDVVGEDIVVSCLKQSEDGQGIVVRLQNLSDRKTDARIAVNRDLGTPASAEAVDLLERPCKGVAVHLAGACVRTLLPPRGIVSIRMVLKGEG